ncbi:MAG: phosphoadenylyl-sulfate reductase [Candidatus Acidoferrales bacterium]
MVQREELARVRAHFEGQPAEPLLNWALGEFHPEIALACSFGAEDVALIDMLCRIHPRPRVFYLDTQFHFRETYEARDRIQQRYSVELLQCLPELSVEEQAARYGPGLYAREPDLCCQLRKVLPLQKMLSRLRAWITGVRREQAPARAEAQLVEWDERFGLVKINPLVKWTAKEVWEYLRGHGVPYNALHDRNYPSIGCEPCTRPVKPGDDPRGGRWAGFEKVECGLHTKPA